MSRNHANTTRLRLSLFFFFAFCILSISLAYFVACIGKPYMGVTLSKDNHDWAVKSVDVNGYAYQIGIRVGDRPIEINGQPASFFLERYNKEGEVFRLWINELTIINNRGQVKYANIADSSPTSKSMIELTTVLIVCLIFWIIGFYVFFKKPKNIVALIFCLCGLIFGLILTANIAGERSIFAAPLLSIIATSIGPWLLLHFFLVLPEERTWLRNNPLVYLIYLPAAISLILLPFIGYANGQPLPTFRTFRIMVIGMGLLATVIVAILNFVRTSSVRTRQQMKIVMVSCLAALIPFFLLTFLPTTIWGRPVVPTSLSVLFIAFIPLGMGYAVITQKLMDIDIIIRRSVIYGLITIIMAIILSSGIFLIVGLHDSLGIQEEILITLALGGAATALFGPIKRVVELQVDKLFYKDRYEYRQIIQSLSISLNKLNSLTDISRLIVGTIVNTLNLAGGCLFIKARYKSYEVSASQGIFAEEGYQKKLADLISSRNNLIEFPNFASTAFPGLSFLIPLTAGETEVGVLCLSQKASRQSYSSDDIYLLQGVASVASIALHSSMLISDVSIRDTFVSIASHELRTPLTSILGYAELLLHREPPNIIRERWLKNIYDSSQRLTSMVDDLLNVSRIQSGRVSIRPERTGLFDILDETLLLTKEATRKHTFIVNIDPDLPDIYVDRDKFNHVVVNLLSNAIKYSPDGGCITVSAYEESKEHRVILSISDEGIGIGPTDKASLFTTFHRIQRPETQSVRGSGLGLYIAKEWVEAMGGTIWLESELNKGSTFFITVPIYNSQTTS